MSISLSASKAIDLLKSQHVHGPNCPCNLGKQHLFMNRGSLSILKNAHKQRSSLRDNLFPHERLVLSSSSRADRLRKRFPVSIGKRSLATSPPTPLVTYDYAFDMVGAHVRYGSGVTKEVGFELREMGSKRVMVLTDSYLNSLRPYGPVQTVIDSLEEAKVDYELYYDVVVEPTASSFKKAIKFATDGHFDSFVAVGGGSTMDTAKAANLYSTYPAPFLDYVNAPIGKAKPPPGPLKPLIAIPTTAGTGSETTGVAIFDLDDIGAKTGIAHRLLRPVLGLIDPDNTKTMPKSVIAASGFDVLSHSLESFTAINYYERSPRPLTPGLRPAYQGANPISDVWSRAAIDIINKYFRRAYHDENDDEARAQMMLAATYAGTSLANSGVHLPHGMSYAISGNVNDWRPQDWPVVEQDGSRLSSIIPHGYSVILSAPAVFRWTSQANPQRHLEAALLLGASPSTRPEDAGRALSDSLLPLMKDLGVPNGLKAIGLDHADIPKLVEATLPQHRVTKLAPRPADKEALAKLFEDGITLYN
jgi:hydroxyacid-oxoacid transhydrogenase